jgi:hypothetical protein
MRYAQGGGLSVRARAGQSLRPPKARTWSKRGRTPQVKVSGKGSGRVNLAGMIAVRPGWRTRLIYRVLPYHGRKSQAKGFRERDLAGMLDAAHQRLGYRRPHRAGSAIQDRSR